MAKYLQFQCPACQAEYAVPDSYQPHLEGKAVACAGCQRWWVAFRATSGPPVRLEGGKPVRLGIDLKKYRRTAPTKPAPAAAPDATKRVPLPKTLGVPCLRVAVKGPGVDMASVFELGGKSFLIGRSRCHLNLPRASMPPRAIRIRTAAGGFTFEGLEGFAISIGAMSVLSGQIQPGGDVRLKLDPYDVLLEPSATPGTPIADLDQATAAPATPQPATPQPAAPQPAAPRPILQGAGDLRQQVQEIAVDVRPDQQAFGAPTEDLQELMDGDATITDLGATGYQAMQFGSDNPLHGLEVALVRADGPTQGQRYRITKPSTLIGRTEGDMVVKDRRVSSKHAQLDVAGARVYTLKDLASTNGTTINARPISVGHLGDGDIVGFGGVEFEFQAKKVAG